MVALAVAVTDRKKLDEGATMQNLVALIPISSALWWFARVEQSKLAQIEHVRSSQEIARPQASLRLQCLGAEASLVVTME